MSLWARAFAATGLVLAMVFAIVGVSGWLVFTEAHEDPVRFVDAVVVLGGEHDGREEYGLELVGGGVAPVLLLSDPYPENDAVMRRVCGTELAAVEIICSRPPELTTRGEARLVRQLANERGWKSVLVVSWRYHLPRARMIFEKCFPAGSLSVSMRGVPTPYDYSLARWEFTYLYQYSSLVKNSVQGCDDG